MSGIAGILRRDGRSIPQHWVKLLEESIALRGHDGSGKFQDSVEIETGHLEIVLLHQKLGNTQVDQPIVHCVEDSPSHVLVIDGEVEAFQRFQTGDNQVECAAAVWNQESLQLELIRTGTGIKPLYMLDLGEAGDGVVFCSIPTPLLQIAIELEITTGNLLNAVQQYLLTGVLFGDDNLLSPVKTVDVLEPMELEVVEHEYEQPENRIPSSAGDDLVSLVSALGQPFADPSLLPRLWMYRACSPSLRCDDFISLLPNMKNKMEAFTLGRWHQLLSKLPSQATIVQLASIWNEASVSAIDYCCTPKEIKALTGQDTAFQSYFPESKSVQEALLDYIHTVKIGHGILRQLDCAASVANIDLRVQMSTNARTMPTFPLSSWLQNSESSLGSIAGDLFTSSDAFLDLPIDRTVVSSIFDAHRAGERDEPKLLFMLLTLGLWRRLVLQR